MPPDSRFAPKDRVLVTGGACKGDLATVLGPSPYTFNGEPVWFVQVDDLPYKSTIRESFLQLLPAATESDDDVMSPLRRVRCP